MLVPVWRNHSFVCSFGSTAKKNNNNKRIHLLVLPRENDDSFNKQVTQSTITIVKLENRTHMEKKGEKKTVAQALISQKCTVTSTYHVWDRDFITIDRVVIILASVIITDPMRDDLMSM